MQSNIEEKLNTIVASKSNEIVLWLDGRKAEISTLASAMTIIPGSTEDKLNYLRQEVQRNKLYETLYIADEKGNYFITSGENGNISDRDYFKKVMATGDTVVSDPVVSRATGKNIIVVASPIKINGKITGIVGGIFLLDEISQRLASFKFGKTGYAYMIQSDGLMIAHPNNDLVMKLNILQDSSLDLKFKEAIQKLVRGEKGISRYTFEGTDNYVAYNPIQGTSWGMVVTEPVSELTEQLTSLPISAFLITIIIVLIAVFISNIFLAKTICRPIEKIKSLISQAEQGDLTVRGQVLSQDEIGQLTTSFNQFIGKTQQIIRNIHENAVTFHNSLDDMFHIASNMAAKSEEMDSRTHIINSAVGQIAERIEFTASASSEVSKNINMITSASEEMYSTIQELASASEQISVSLEQVSDNVGQISHSIHDVSGSARDVSNSVNSVATAVKEINISLNEVSRNCERSAQISDNAEIRARETKECIEKLNKSSKQIGKIVNVINDIAEQTNMLALNAAIEAAGAGEAGRGFAVVANEVKELAKQTAEATDEISQQIEAMQTNMFDAVNAVETITQVIEEITGNTNAIASAVTEQSSVTGEISKSVIGAAEKVNYITQQFADVAASTQHGAHNVAEISKGVQEMARSVTELSLAANEVAENTLKASGKVDQVARDAAEISKGANEIAQGMQEISQASSETAVGAEDTSRSVKELSGIFQKLEDLSMQFNV